MLCRLALLTLLAALAACEPRPQARPPEPPKEEKPAQPPLSTKQVTDLSEKCAKSSREQFQRALRDGIETTSEGKAAAEHVSHYNAKLNSCFYLLTVTSAATLKKMLFDINGGELYGEFLGGATLESPAARPKACRVESFYCASAGEWEVLVRSYMEE